MKRKFTIPKNAGPSPNTAGPETGAPGSRVLGPWHSRGYLPHFDSPGVVQHISIHLADSLPEPVIRRLEEELKFFPHERRDAEKRKRIEAWADAGHGSCILADPEIAEMVQASLLHFDSQRYRLIAWVVMPNHVHNLVEPLNGWSIARIVASWKKFTARTICDHLRAYPGNANLPIGALRRGASKHTHAIQENGVPRPVWHREYWDRYIRNAKHFSQAVAYIHENPVKAGLVPKPEDWQWSSARFINPGNANLPIGVLRRCVTNRAPAIQKINDPGPSTAIQENGAPRKKRRAETLREAPD